MVQAFVMLRLTSCAARIIRMLDGRRNCDLLALVIQERGRNEPVFVTDSVCNAEVGEVFHDFDRCGVHQIQCGAVIGSLELVFL